MKFYTTEDFAQKKEIAYSSARRQASEDKLWSITVTRGLANLVVEKDEGIRPNIISFLNLKGGCGKSTISTHFAVLLAKLGFKVLIIDSDHQNQVKLFFPTQDYSHSLKTLLDNESTIEESIYSAVANSDRELDFSVDIIYSDYALALIKESAISKDRLSQVIEPVKDNYDFIIIDTAPDFDSMTRTVVDASTNIIIPVVPNRMHIEGLKHTMRGLTQVANAQNKITGIIANQVVTPALEQQTAYLAYVQEEFPDFAYENNIPIDNYLPKVVDFETNIFDYREKSKGSQAIKRFVWETLRRL